MKEERCCGYCCWFCFEQTDGEGQCPSGDGEWLFTNCRSTPCKDFISRQEMRHHMAVLLQRLRFQKDNDYSFHPKRKYPIGVFEAMEFAYKYMKVFSKI